MTVPKAYVYNSEIVSVYDGDTVTAIIDLGMSLSRKVSCRLYGIDTPEIHSKVAQEKVAAAAARERITELIMGKPVVMESVAKPDKYGRLLVKIWTEDGKCVNDTLLEENLALPYDGGTKSDWSEFLSR